MDQRTTIEESLTVEETLTADIKQIPMDLTEGMDLSHKTTTTEADLLTVEEWPTLTHTMLEVHLTVDPRLTKVTVDPRLTKVTVDPRLTKVTADPRLTKVVTAVLRLTKVGSSNTVNQPMVEGRMAATEVPMAAMEVPMAAMVMAVMVGTVN